MPTNNDDLRAAGEALFEQGRAVVQEARRPLLAMVGAGELAVTQLREQLRELPTGTQDQLRRLSDRATELRGRVREMDPTSVRANMGTYLAQARSVYESLAERGEQVMARHTPRSSEPEPAGDSAGSAGPSGPAGQLTAGSDPDTEPGSGSGPGTDPGAGPDA